MATAINSFILISLNVACLRDLKSKAGLIDILKRGPDVCLLQEVNIGTLDLETIVNKYGYKAASNIDITDENSRGTAFIWRDGLPISEVSVVEPCRLQVATLGSFSILNIYAPSGTKNKYARKEFYSGPVMRAVRSLTVHNVPPIIGGDFNCILNKKDAMANQQQKMCPALRDLVKGFGYQDAFRHLYPNTISYTFHRRNTASRLDRFYFGQMNIPNLQEVLHFPVSFSDHDGVLVKMFLPDISKPPPPPKPRSTYWKVNNSVLKDPDFKENFTRVWNLSNKTKNSHPSVVSWWENVFKSNKVYKVYKVRNRRNGRK